MTKYQLDKSYGKSGKFDDADHRRNYWLKKSIGERLQGAWFLIAQAYGFPVEKSPSLERHVFNMKKHQPA